MTYIVLQNEEFVAATDDILSALERMKLCQGKVETEDGVELARISPKPSAHVPWRKDDRA